MTGIRQDMCLFDMELLHWVMVLAEFWLDHCVGAAFRDDVRGFASTYGPMSPRRHRLALGDKIASRRIGAAQENERLPEGRRGGCASDRRRCWSGSRYAFKHDNGEFNAER
jgi:hypothetical protein